MTTRLTNEMRDEIVASVLAATNLDLERKEIERLTRERAAEVARNAQPEGWFDFIRGKPKEWFKLDANLYVDSCNPLVVLDIRGSWHRRIDYVDPIPVAVEPGVSGEAAEVVFGELFKTAQAWAEKRATARGELMAFLHSCRTVEKVIERMPELEPHCKVKAKVYPLVAPSNVLSKLSALGFDRTAA